MEKLNKIGYCFYQIVLFVARINWLLLKIKNSPILMITLKRTESLTNFYLTGDKFMPELHLKQPGFTYIACGTFTKHCQEILKK